MTPFPVCDVIEHPHIAVLPLCRQRKTVINSQRLMMWQMCEVPTNRISWLLNPLVTSFLVKDATNGQTRVSSIMPKLTSLNNSKMAQDRASLFLTVCRKHCHCIEW
jgi:hypothetical protein